MLMQENERREEGRIGKGRERKGGGKNRVGRGREDRKPRRLAWVLGRGICWKEGGRD